MKSWLQQRALRLRLAAGNALAAAVVWLVCLVGALATGLWQPHGYLHLVLGLLVGGPLAAVLFGVVSYLIAGRALAPLQRLMAALRGLPPKAWGEPVPAANPHDELGQLAGALNEMRQQLQESLAELDRLTADVSHELRTPLTAMRAVGEVALRERNPVVLYDALGSMLEEIGRLQKLIDRLLVLSRPGSQEMAADLEAGLLRHVLAEVGEALSLVAAEKQQPIQVDCPDHLLAVFDPALLRLALMNLTQNAIRFSPPGKPITLRALADEEGTVAVEVIDGGPGIAPEHQQRIFERFYRVDQARSRAEGGVGLGLAIVKWAVERMGGKVELRSEVGRGSIFCLRLRPVAAG